MNNDQNLLDDSIFKSNSEFQIAPFKKRLVNCMIDLLVIFFLSPFVMFALIIGIQKIFNTTVDRGVDFDVVMAFIFLGTYVLYYFIFEALTKGRTLGKLITKTRVVSTTSSNLTIKRYAIRAICRFIPFEPVSIVEGGEMWHDSLAKTKVVCLLR